MLTADNNARLHAAAGQLSGLRSNGSLSWIDVDLSTSGVAVTHPVCVLAGDQYFQVFTPLARGGTTEVERAPFMRKVDVLNLMAGDDGQYQTWGLIPLPGPVVALSLGVDYASEALYSPGTLAQLVNRVAKEASTVSVDAELPGIRRDLGLV